MPLQKSISRMHLLKQVKKKGRKNHMRQTSYAQNAGAISPSNAPPLIWDKKSLSRSSADLDPVMVNYTVPKDKKNLEDTHANFIPQPASKLTNQSSEAHHYETDKEKAA